MSRRPSAPAIKQSRGRRQTFALAASLALSAVLGNAGADTLEPGLAVTLHAGSPGALAASARLDARNGGLSRVPLPTRPTPTYRVKLAAPIQYAPAADERGALIVAHGAGKLTELDARGRVAWSLRVGPDVAAAGPLIGNDGQRWLVTVGAEIAGVSPSGQLRFRRPLTGFGSVDGVLAVPLSTGGVALASAGRLALLDRDGRTLWLALHEEPIRALLERRGELLVVAADGRILRRGAEGRLSPLAELKGRVDAAALSPDADAVIAVLEQRELVRLELATGKRSVLLAEPSLTLSSGLAVGGRGELRVLVQGGLLVGLSQGKEAFRAPLAAAPGASPPPDPLLDERGVAAVSVPDGGLSLVTATGEIELVPGSACPEPLRPTPLGPGHLALSCRSGLVFAVSGKAR